MGGGPTFDPPGRSGPLEPWEVVGVVADVRQRSVIEPATPQIFMDQRQVPGPTGGSALNMVVRIDGDAAALLSDLRSMVAQADPTAFVDNIAPMDRIVSNTYARPRLYALVLGIYAVVAISLAAIGIYGVMAFAVVRRTREIGIRMALGARRRQVQALVVRDSAIVAGAGLAIGIGGAVWSSRLFEGLLFGITPLDQDNICSGGGGIRGDCDARVGDPGTPGIGRRSGIRASRGVGVFRWARSAMRFDPWRAAAVSPSPPS